MEPSLTKEWVKKNNNRVFVFAEMKIFESHMLSEKAKRSFLSRAVARMG
jgi:hypothetical protein